MVGNRLQLSWERGPAMGGNRLQLSWEWGLAMVGNRLQLSWECVPVQLGMDISLVGNGFQLWSVMGCSLVGNGLQLSWQLSWDWVPVLFTFSQEAGVLLFYFKLLVRNYYYFYMSDLTNAVYNLICIIVKYVLLTSAMDNHPNLLKRPVRYL